MKFQSGDIPHGFVIGSQSSKPLLVGFGPGEFRFECYLFKNAAVYLMCKLSSKIQRFTSYLGRSFFNESPWPPVRRL